MMPILRTRPTFFFASSTLVSLAAASFMACSSSGNMNTGSATSSTGGAASTGSTGNGPATTSTSAGPGSGGAASTGSSVTATSSAGTGGAAATGSSTSAGTGGTGGAPASSSTATSSATASATATSSTASSSSSSGGAPTQVLVTTLDPGVLPVAVTINQGTAIGQGPLNGATPVTLTDLAADPNNKETIGSATDPFARTGTVPDTAAGFCNYSGGTPTRITHVTGQKFEGCVDGGPGTDPMVPMAPFYFPLVYNSTVTTSGNACGGQPPVIGLFDWRPKDIDEAVVVAESDDFGKTWYFMQTVLELNPDYTNPISGGYSATSTDTGCPASVTSTNANFVSVNGATADDGWGHAAIIQLPGAGNAETGGQFLYLLDRNTANMPGTSTPYVDNAPLHVIQLNNASPKFPIWNTNHTNNDIKSISSALNPTVPDAGTATVQVQSTSGLLNPDGIMAVFPTAPTAAAGSPVTVLYVQKIVNGDNTGPTALPAAQQCKKAPFSGKTNHDISNVRLATTTDGINFTDMGIVQGLNDPTTVDYNETRWVSPRGTLVDIKGDGSVWGLYFAGGNCLDGDSDAFHFIGYAESTDKVHWTVYNDINHPIASINTITTANQAGGAMVTVPANAPIVPTQYWFAERLYAPTAVQIDTTHLSVTFAGYGVQSPNADLLDYRQIGNVVLTVSSALPAGTPNNINAH